MYSDRTDSELMGILEQQAFLTFESQLNLRDELAQRAMVVDTTELDDSISQKLIEINNLDYLKDFGFKAEENQDGITVTRTKNATITDVLGIIMGVLVFLLGVYGIGCFGFAVQK